MFKKKVILGIHGLRNKPPCSILSDWWRRSIMEGFEALDKPIPDFRWDMAYWAHFIHPTPQDPSISDKKKQLYLKEPYVVGERKGPREPLPFIKMIKNEFRRYFLLNTVCRFKLGGNVFLTNVILKTMFKELDIYYHGTLPDTQGVESLAKTLIRRSLIEKLEQYRGAKIMLVAHSMGAIIAYDVLTTALPNFPIHTFVTLGAPLGYPIIVKKIRYEQPGHTPMEKLLTPSNIQKAWYNLSDMEDITALNYNLRYVFDKNKNGVRPFDRIVFNNYQYRGRLNPHKSFGYLRTSDFTQIVTDFLTSEKSPLGS